MTVEYKNSMIMIVDDDQEDIYLTKRAFKAYRKEIGLISVNSGTDMFDYLSGEGDYNGQDTQLPSIILLDINMPQLNGFEVVSMLRKNPKYAHIPVIMLTTSDADQDVKRAYDSGANSYICKSVNADEMKIITARLCEFWLDLAKLPKAA